MKDQLIFDTTNATTIADSDSVGAFLRSSDGTLLTHSTVGGSEALDVNIVNTLGIDVDLDHTEDSVRLGDGTSFFTSTSENGDIALDVHLSNSNIEVTQGTSPWVIGDGGGSITVDGSDFDIRDLAFATDSVTAHQGGTWTIDSITNDVNVTATDLDIRDLSASQDNVAISDGTDTLAVNADGSINVVSTGDPALADTAIANAAVTLAVANTAQDVVASPLSSRKYLFVYNKDNQKMYVGSTGVTSSNGFPVSPGSYLELRAGASIDIEYVSSKVGHEARTLELS